MDQEWAQSDRRPVVVGEGGATRAGSSTERALKLALAAAEQAGAVTILLGEEFLATLPNFDPKPGGPTPAQRRLIKEIARADGNIVASPDDHGSISGVVKNVLDTLELGGAEPRGRQTGRSSAACRAAQSHRSGSDPRRWRKLRILNRKLRISGEV